MDFSKWWMQASRPLGYFVSLGLYTLSIQNCALNNNNKKRMTRQGFFFFPIWFIESISAYKLLLLHSSSPLKMSVF